MLRETFAEPLDPAIWYVSDYSTEFCTFKPENVEVKDGFLYCRVPSGLAEGGQIQTRELFSHGTFQCSMKTSNIPNTLTALFTYYKDETMPGSDQIALESWGNNPSVMLFSCWNKGVRGRKSVDLGFDSSMALHTYGFSWFKDHIDVYVDGILVYRHTYIPSIPTLPQKCLLCLFNSSWEGPTPSDAEAIFDWITITPPPPPIDLPEIGAAILTLIDATLVGYYIATHI